MKPLGREKEEKTALGLIMPLFLFIPSIFIDAFGPSFLSAGYGSYACFPNTYPANLIFFTGPVFGISICEFILLNFCYYSSLQNSN